MTDQTINEVIEELEALVFYFEQRQERAEIATKLDVADAFGAAADNIFIVKERISNLRKAKLN